MRNLPQEPDMDLVGLRDGIAPTTHTVEDALRAGRRAPRTATGSNPRQSYQDKRAG